jgi:hypothetical protein
MCGKGHEDCRCGVSNWHPDNEAWDATDSAHPAWWRGQEHGVASTCRILEAALDGKGDGRGVIGYAPMERLRRRLLALPR